MATQVPTSSNPPVSTLVKGIVDDLGDLIKQQFRFARTELKADIRKSAGAIALLASGAGIAILGGLFLCLMLVHLLHWLTVPAGYEPDPARLPLWSCYAIVGGLFLAAGASLVFAGVKKFRSFNPLPDQTVDTLKENVQWIRSEEHTSELQSLRHLVCRLLLEKT